MTPDELLSFRTRMKLTQADCAKALGCSPRSVSKWEKGESKIPKSIGMAAAAYAMGLSSYGSEEFAALDKALNELRSDVIALNNIVIKNT